MSLRPGDAFIVAAVVAGLLLVAAAATLATTLIGGAFALLEIVATALDRTTLM